MSKTMLLLCSLLLLPITARAQSFTEPGWTQVVNQTSGLPTNISTVSIDNEGNVYFGTRDNATISSNGTIDNPTSIRRRRPNGRLKVLMQTTTVTLSLIHI